jgi:hypothetical protein
VRSVISSMRAEADRGPEKNASVPLGRKPPQGVKRLVNNSIDRRDLPAHQFPPRREEISQVPPPTLAENSAAPGVANGQLSPNRRDPPESLRQALGHPTLSGLTTCLDVREDELRVNGLQVDEYERRVYRNRTVSMLRRYLRCSLETGRLPSLLGSEFFRAKTRVSARVTFEDRVIFVHDMENCLQRLDEFSQRLIARHILQEHDCENTARLLQCNEKTVRRLIPLALDRLSEMLLERGLMEALVPRKKNSCQEGEKDEIGLSDWEDDENKF